MQPQIGSDAASTSRHTLWFEHALLPRGWAERVRVVTQAGRIVALDIGVELHPGEERHAIAIAGMPNLHSHAFQRAMAGLTAQRGSSADSFWSWREAMYRLAERLQPDDLRAIAAQAYVEMLEAGYTRVGEFHYLHHAPDGQRYGNLAENCARIIEAAAETGIGLTLLPVFYAHSGFGAAPPQARQVRFVCTLDEFAQLFDSARAQASAMLGDAVVAVAPHSLRAVTPAQLVELIELAPDQPLHIHIAEQQAEVAACLAWCGQRPVAWLMDNAPVDARWCLVHATHMDQDETVRLARSAAVAGLCPITEADLGDGIFPAAEYVAAGGVLGVGSDSNVLIDVAQELRLLEYGQRLQRQARNVLALPAYRTTGRSLFELACKGGAQALGIAEAAIEVGASADIVSLNARHPALLERSDDELLDSWIFAARESAIDCVWRHGRCVVRGGQHIGRAAIAERYERALRRLLP